MCLQLDDRLYVVVGGGITLEAELAPDDPEVSSDLAVGADC